MCCSKSCCCAEASSSLLTNSKTYGFTSIPFQFNKSITKTIWKSFNLPGLSGTVVIIGNIIAGTMLVAINGLNTTRIKEHETFSVSSNPLNSVTIKYKTATEETSSITVSLSASRFEY